jgi:hypothetical protein
VRSILLLLPGPRISSLYAVQHEPCYSSMPGATIGKPLIDVRYYCALCPWPGVLPAPNPGNRPLQRFSFGSLSCSLSIDFRPPVTDPASPSPPPCLPPLLLPCAFPSSPARHARRFPFNVCRNLFSDDDSLHHALYRSTLLTFLHLFASLMCVIISPPTQRAAGTSTYCSSRVFFDPFSHSRAQLHFPRASGQYR